jgi:hypothetical protein
MAGEGLAAAKLGGWRALVLQGSKPVAAVEFIGGSGDPKDFKSLNQGPYVQGTVSALAAAEAAAQVIQNDFEPRVLQIPSIYLMALWLHGSGENLFVPMEPAPGRLKANQIYTEAKFFREAFDLASRRKQFDDRPKGEPPAAAPGPR